MLASKTGRIASIYWSRMHRIDVSLKPNVHDARGRALLGDIRDLGINTVSDVRVADIYWLDAELSSADLSRLCRELLADPLLQDCQVDREHADHEERDAHAVEVTYNPGVTDPVQQTLLKAINDMGITGVREAKTGVRHLIKGPVSSEELELITRRLLVNPIIQHVVSGDAISFGERPRYEFELKRVALLDATESRVSELADRFGFSEAEMRAVVSYFKGTGRDPTDAELETISQTWSEHCVHKTFKARINFAGRVIDNLFESTIVRATEELDKPWCLSVFRDNAGVIDFDGQQAICFKVETHNHPSAVEPYGGAATGLGGVVRDVLGTGLSAKPIFNTDVFCFAPPDTPYERLPEGVLHPRPTFKGVRAGVADYGNRLGIPTINGAVLFDEAYLGIPLVYCGTGGIMPKESAPRGQQKAGDAVVLIGGRTGRDGIHGVTFASERLTDRSSELSYSAVQIGNPIEEKKMVDALLKARDRGLFSRITDCGGGGLSSAVGEMGEETGVHVYLDRVPLKYSGLSYEEIWISESQERMVLAVDRDRVRELLDLFEHDGVEATVIGEFTNDRRLQLFYEGRQVADLDMGFLHKGRPQLAVEATWTAAAPKEPELPMPQDAGEVLMQILGSWNVCSKEWVIRQYDHEVQGTSVLKPLVGKDNDGPSDAAIIRPVLGSDRGLIVASGINPSYGKLDPYWMAASVIDEALRQIVAVGGNLERVALLDNFCWGDVSDSENLGALVRACEACYDMSKAYGAPFISGKDSLNNELQTGERRVSIPHTLLISAVAVMEDVGQATSIDLKEEGNLLYVVGLTYEELGGSEYFRLKGVEGGRVPQVRPEQARGLMSRLSQTTREGLVRACHDLSEGGLGVAAAEMAFAGGLGAELWLEHVPQGERVARDDYLLFSESNSRFLVEVRREQKEPFEKVMGDEGTGMVGRVADSGRLEMHGRNGTKLVDRHINELKEAWQRPLRW
ncbi:MAG: phosphoribosylformylglycinamidine synthase subunit PurL [Chloroflexota bacterium]